MEHPTEDFECDFEKPSVQEYVALVQASGLRRPYRDTARVEQMLSSSNIFVCIRSKGKLVGLSRAWNDGWTCYLADLCVDAALQKTGLGRKMVEKTREAIGPFPKILLLASRVAQTYYSHIGFEAVTNAWALPGEQGAFFEEWDKGTYQT